ncbi:exosortase A [Altererythrobacter aquiaggeris]|uniref:exosortase A n=1 Tax=Aestuarierythrobacter aquiaggeris TaxID=1898396 RepID=UPI00301B67B7
MQPDAALKHQRRDGALHHVPQSWRVPLPYVTLVWAALVILFIEDWAAMAGQWWNSSTYNHILLIPGIFAVLMWQRRDALAQITPMAWWPGLVFFAGALFVWLLGAFSDLDLARQLGAVTALIGAFAALLGPRVSAASLFPLAYLLFLIPFGDELVPALQMVTAHLTIGLTHLSGIPAKVEGVFIDTPAGLFEVAEACSGVKFLVAMTALGALVAATSFRSWKRRTVFMMAALLLPILANGVRAWGTIYIAQSQGIEFAAGFDHIFYGWVFFAIVMGLLLGLSWRWFDRSPDDSPVDAAHINASAMLQKAAGFSVPGSVAAATGIAMLLAVSLWASAADGLSASISLNPVLPDVEGWQQVDYSPNVEWEPLANGADHKLRGRYRGPDGQVVDAVLAIYTSQGEGREAGGFGQGALVPDSPWRWLENGQSIDGAKAEYLLANGRIKRFAATWYRRGEFFAGSNARLKLELMRSKLVLKAAPTSTLVLSAEAAGAQDPSAPVRQFARDAGPLNEWIDRIVQTD